ncbi:LOW QUALITY PROTEIN: histone-lysine N-methyltransferase EHMT1-like [Ruditapes philippinarum]|uniref:LOW QUALITY PROTEIN: histone-lysine N-methyltransferase EHMT1-like n=1 Tax=Ruditapes philippinarum TaxID=129788 RepID=UPI00295B23BA|nr:LOW QUALITY PROTEIN: histone-lysine N-methyltransferase EHMT1-like [Ruditapes philippinarum]
MPKPSKRKAFEPIKIPTPEKDKISSSPPKKGSPVRSPLKSPIKSPSKTENPFFKKQKLIRRKKKKAYKLPGEKVWKRTKSKKSEERQLAKDSEIETHSSEQKVSQRGASMPVSSTPNKVPNKTSDHSVESTKSPPQRNALDMLTMNSRKSFSSASSGGSMKKARKTVRHGIDPATHRTLDSFLKSKIQDVADRTVGAERTSDGSNGEPRKRKAVDQVKSKTNTETDYSLASPEEKKRRMELSPTQQHVIALMPTGSPPLSMPTAGHPIIPASGTGSQLFLSPGAASGSQTIIPNGTLFQIFNNQSIASSQTAQFVAIAQSQGGHPMVTAASPPKSTNLLQPKGVPLLFTPMPYSTVVANGTGCQPVFSHPGVFNSVTSSVMGKPVPTGYQSAVQQQHSVLKNTLIQPRMQLPNGQYIDLKLPKDVPNGMYPVTPPRTPEEQRSETGSQDTGEEMEAVLGSVTPEKDVIPLCTCKISGASFQKMTTIVTFCQALDSVDGKVLGCCNKVTNPQLVRPAVKIPFLALCDSHRKRLRAHQCCPGCGHFCTQGKFLQCKKEGSSFVHNFHEQCQVTKDGKNYCPHCGETSNQYEVYLSMQESKQSVAKEMKPSNRAQVKARIGVVDHKSTSGGEEPTEDPVVTHTLEKTKKVISTADVPLGPDRYSLERVLSSLEHERPKKYRHLPKCLYTPAYDNDLERVVYMLEDGFDPNELFEDLEGQSALHAAAAVGSLSIVHVLIQAGASPHHQDRSLKTPLMFAAENNHADVVHYLIKANAIIDAKADDGMTALHFAAKAGHVNIINMLLNTDRLNIDTTDDGGWTPLIWAAEHMEVEAVKLLLKRKADPNLRDSEENTTMHWAAFSGSVTIAELLLSAGCDLDSLNMHGDRPLHIAARQDHYECVVLFLARGADVEAKNNKGETPLECCIEQTTAVYLALKVNKQLKSFGAKHMGKPDKLIHRDLSKGRENIPIPCVNGVDDEGEPKDYLYVVDNIETTCLNINRVIGSLQTCQCKDDCSSIYCACGKNSVDCWYDKYNRLIPEFNMLEPPLIFECNRACECWTTCNNRVVQNGVMSRLQVFKTVGRGWGCKTLVDIARGTFICEYIGEHISDSEADRREDDSYLFDLDNKDGETYCIDARRFGNVARFINHLCEPNLTPVKVFVDSQDLRFPRICLFANRDIKAQEELGFDYGEKFWIIKWKQFTCTCGSLKCRYSSDTIQKTLEEYRQRHEIDGEEMQD